MKRYEALEIVRASLGGKCSKRRDTCPKYAGWTLEDEGWGCSDCVEMFEDIVELRPTFGVNPCPCLSVDDGRIPIDVLLHRLDEYIDELKERDE